VQPDAVLNLMKAYFADRQPPEVLDRFAEQSPRALLTESLDVVDFVVYLEEELGREISIQRLGQALLDKNFGELSVEVPRMLAES
jgi:acyl carrier protein